MPGPQDVLSGTRHQLLFLPNHHRVKVPSRFLARRAPSLLLLLFLPNHHRVKVPSRLLARRVPSLLLLCLPTPVLLSCRPLYLPFSQRTHPLFWMLPSVDLSSQERRQVELWQEKLMVPKLRAAQCFTHHNPHIRLNQLSIHVVFFFLSRICSFCVFTFKLYARRKCVWVNGVAPQWDYINQSDFSAGIQSRLQFVKYSGISTTSTLNASSQFLRHCNVELYGLAEPQLQHFLPVAWVLNADVFRPNIDRNRVALVSRQDGKSGENNAIITKSATNDSTLNFA